MILALDPSLHCTGWAVCHNDGTLHSYGNERVDSKVKGIEAVMKMVSSFMDSMEHVDLNDLKYILLESQEYRGKHAERMKVNDLMNLHAVSLSLASALVQRRDWFLCNPKVKFYAPQTWNKGRPKKVTHERMKSKYSEDSFDGPDYDYLDALGIIDYYLSGERKSARIGKSGV